MSAALVGALLIATPVQAETEAEQVAAIEAMLKKDGLEKVLASMASSGTYPQKVNALITVLDIEADGPNYRTSYAWTGGDAAFTEAMRAQILQQNCSRAVLVPLFKAGAIYDQIYYGSDGHTLGVVTVTRQVCGF